MSSKPVLFILVLFAFGAVALPLAAQTDYYWNRQGISNSYHNRFNWALEPGGSTGHGVPTPGDRGYFLGSGLVTSMGEGDGQLFVSHFADSNFTFDMSGGEQTFQTSIRNEGNSRLTLRNGTLLAVFAGFGTFHVNVSGSGGLQHETTLGQFDQPDVRLNVDGGSVNVGGWVVRKQNQIQNGGYVLAGDSYYEPGTGILGTGDVNISPQGGRVSIDGGALYGRNLLVSGDLSSNSGVINFARVTIGLLGNTTISGGSLNAVSDVRLDGALSVQGGELNTKRLLISDSAALNFTGGDIRVRGDSSGSGVLDAGDFGFTGATGANPRLILTDAEGTVDEFNAGFGGTAQLRLDGQSIFSSGHSRLAANGGYFSANVGGVWNSTETLIGHSGTALVSVYGELNTVNGRVGAFAGADGTVRVWQGTWNSSSRIRVAEGASTNGMVEISNGGVVNTPTMVIGHSVESTGSATIDGVGSQLNITGVGMAVGNEGTGSLSITSGGSWISTNVNVGSFGGTGTVSLSGSGSYWNNSGLIRIGRANDAIGTLNVESHAQILTSSMVIGDEADSTGSVFVADNGLLDVSSLTVGNQGSGVLEIDDGNVTADSMSIGNRGLVAFQSGVLTSSTIDLVGTAEFDFLGGTLSVESFASSLVQNGGTLAPGNSAGSTTIEGNYTLNGGSIEIELGGLIAGMEHDYVSTTGDLILNSAGLDVSLLNGFSLSENDEFLILSVDGNQFGFFNGLGQDELVGTFGSNRLWIDYLAGDGNDIRLYATAVPEPTSLSMVGVLVIGFCSRRKRKVSDK